MRWIHDFQLFLFDLDGLLVNTEEIHYLAYKKMCEGRGVELQWDFNDYCKIAHYSSEGLREQIYAQYPSLFQMEPNWNVLYEEKKQAIIELFKQGAVHLMPGVKDLLEALSAANIPRCVVTHSALELVSLIREKNPILNTIPEWFTRENYTQAKPNPECYLKAIEKFAKPTDKVIGFEDSPRGITALLQTRAVPILVCTTPYPEITSFKDQGVHHFTSFNEILNTMQ